jgi:hypothetical protein
MHGGPEELKTEDEIKAGIEAIRATYTGPLPFLRDGSRNPNFKPQERPSTVPSVLDEDDEDE